MAERIVQAPETGEPESGEGKTWKQEFEQFIALFEKDPTGEKTFEMFDRLDEEAAEIDDLAEAFNSGNQGTS